MLKIIIYIQDSLKDMKESGLPNWAKTPDSKEAKQAGTTAIIEEEGQAPVKKEPFSKRRDSSESANGKRKDSGETTKPKDKVEVKSPQTPVKVNGTPKKSPVKEKTLETSYQHYSKNPSPENQENLLRRSIFFSLMTGTISS